MHHCRGDAADAHRQTNRRAQPGRAPSWITTWYSPPLAATTLLSTRNAWWPPAAARILQPLKRHRPRAAPRDPEGQRRVGGRGDVERRLPPGCQRIAPGPASPGPSRRGCWVLGIFPPQAMRPRRMKVSSRQWLSPERPPPGLTAHIVQEKREIIAIGFRRHLAMEAQGVGSHHGGGQPGRLAVADRAAFRGVHAIRSSSWLGAPGGIAAGHPHPIRQVQRRRHGNQRFDREQKA